MPSPFASSARCASRGFTLIELVVAIAVILVLMALLVPAVMVVMHSVQSRTATHVVATLQQAIEAYRQDDAQHRYPSQPNADRSLSRQQVDGTRSALGTLALLEGRGFQVGAEQEHDGDTRLIDPWGAAYRYWPSMRRQDVVADGVLPDWNWDAASNHAAAWGRRPDPATQALADGELIYPYVWSLGRTPPDPSTWIHCADVRR